MLADYCWDPIRETPAGENKRQKKTKLVFNAYFLVRITYLDIVHFLIMYSVIRNQYITFYYKSSFFFNLIPSPLTMVRDRANVVIFGVNNVQTMIIIQGAIFFKFNPLSLNNGA